MNDFTLNLSHKRIQQIIWVLLCLIPVVGMAVDLIAPSLPAIASSLHVSSGVAKDVITIYLLGYALGNFTTGFLTDALGRQKLLRIGLIAFIIASMLPVVIPRIETLLLSRFLQGFTIGWVAVIARAIFSDVLPPEKLVRLGVLMGSMFGIGPVIGPLIGGYLQFYFGYQACFIFFALIVLVLTIAIFLIVPETHFKRNPLSIITIRHNLTEILTDRKFMALVIMMGSVYSMLITFNTVGPFLIQTELKYSPIFFGRMALVLGLVFLASTFISRYLLGKYTVEQLYRVFVNSFFVMAILAVVISYFVENNIVLIMITSAVMFFASGCIFPMSMGKGLSLFRHIAGTASATMYFINILMTSLTAFILSFVSVQSSLILFCIYFVLMAICVIVYWRLIHNRI